MFNPRSSSKKLLSFSFFAALMVVVLDQITKFLGQENSLLNTGISFSFGTAAESLTLFLSLFFLGLVAFVSWQLQSERRWYVLAAYGVLLGGGFSNLMDRWIYGGVRDVWNVPILALTNNLADWAIFLSVVFLLIHEIIPMYSHVWNRK